MEAEDKALAEMDRAELLEALYGGLYTVLVEDEEYEDLGQVVFAIGLKHYIEQKLEKLSDEEIRGLFDNAEALMQGILEFASEKGVLEFEEESEEGGEGCGGGCSCSH
ncbi:MAG: hypothetical protein AB1916_01105 [Thermodesulfobacteriota bacterium]